MFITKEIILILAMVICSINAQLPSVPGINSRTCSDGTAATVPCDINRSQCTSGRCTYFPTFADGQYYCCPFAQPAVGSFATVGGLPIINALFPAALQWPVAVNGITAFSNKVCPDGVPPSLPCDASFRCTLSAVQTVCTYFPQSPYFPSYFGPQYYCCSGFGSASVAGSSGQFTASIPSAPAVGGVRQATPGGRTCANGLAPIGPCDSAGKCAAGTSCTYFPTFEDEQYYCCVVSGKS